jgi:transcriptional regulator of heat shock response
MHERHAKVLSGLITEYIKTGQAVSSKQLAKKKQLKLSSASIRSIMQDLCNTGFAYQPHTSAGRIPTDAGYRYYLDNLSVGPLPAVLRTRLYSQYEDLVAKHGSKQLAMVELLAQLTQSLAVVGNINNHQFEQSGISGLFLGESEDQLDLMQEISVLLDNMHQMLAELSSLESGGTTVFIGSENPYFTSAHISIMLQPARSKSKDKKVIMLIGPKRMQYRRNLSLLNEIEDIFNS